MVDTRRDTSVALDSCGGFDLSFPFNEPTEKAALALAAELRKGTSPIEQQAHLRAIVEEVKQRERVARSRLRASIGDDRKCDPKAGARRASADARLAPQQDASAW